MWFVNSAGPLQNDPEILKKELFTYMCNDNHDVYDRLIDKTAVDLHAKNSEPFLTLCSTNLQSINLLDSHGWMGKCFS